MTIHVTFPPMGGPKARGMAARRALRAAERILGWPARVLEARATMAQLAALDTHMLADIGLTPADVGNASALAADVDPGGFLERAGRRGSERARRQAIVRCANLCAAR